MMRQLVLVTGLLIFAAMAHSQDEQAAAAPSMTASLNKSLGVYVFPAKDQKSEQQAKDERACYSWAVEQSGVDPLNMPATKPDSVAKGPDRSAVRGAARGAVAGVAIGAIAGDAGKGAARGEAAGGMAGDLDPRAYARVPVDMTFVVAGFAYSNGGIVTDVTSPVQNMQVDVETPSSHPRSLVRPYCPEPLFLPFRRIAS